ncbi:hypothetical protein ACSVDE_02455 [Pseudalkalibacillus sp. Hm43]|uniref:hypothetical protein n=1 Tax=Pseudalkalibacillus sp. Hm43 TaxID=3450742 RepID=UPI003F4446B8
MVRVLVTLSLLVIANVIAALLLGFHFLDLAVMVGITAVIVLLVLNISHEGSGSHVDPQTLSFVSTPESGGNGLDRQTIISLLVAISYTAVSLLFLLF